ncbi:MAG TPA: tetratricopeptide repeat protein [Bryobacteraceae bacterium]|nr:tetratricopeptide repeat protein [Bryobacteraceae bacterium]
MKLCLALASAMAVSLLSQSFEDLARKAESMVDQGPAQAAALFKQALDLRPSWPEGWFYLGGALYRLDRYTEARDAFLKGLDLSPQNGMAWGFLGMTEYELGDLKKAAIDIDKAEKIGLGPNLGFEAAVRQRGAMILIRSSLFDQAMAQLQPLAKRGENSAQVVEAVGLCALAVAAEPEKLPEARRKVVDMAGAAMWAATSQRPKDAKDGFAALLDKYPNEPGVHYAAGLFLMDSDQQAALEEFHRELKQSPNHWPTMLVTAFLETRSGQPDVSLQWADKARQLAPQGYMWLCDAETGRALLAKDQPEKAVPYFERAVKQQPDNAQTHFYLEQAYRRAGRKEDAAKERAEFTRLKALQDPLAVPGIGTSR